MKAYIICYYPDISIASGSSVYIEEVWTDERKAKKRISELMKNNPYYRENGFHLFIIEKTIKGRK